MNRRARMLPSTLLALLVCPPLLVAASSVRPLAGQEVASARGFFVELTGGVYSREGRPDEARTSGPAASLRAGVRVERFRVTLETTNGWTTTRAAGIEFDDVYTAFVAGAEFAPLRGNDEIALGLGIGAHRRGQSTNELRGHDSVNWTPVASGGVAYRGRLGQGWGLVLDARLFRTEIVDAIADDAGIGSLDWTLRAGLVIG